MSETKKTQGQNAGSCKVELATITDKKDSSRSVSVAGGFIEMRYYESILQDGTQASFIFADAGNSIDGKTVSEGLPLNGGETFKFKVKIIMKRH